LRGTSFAYTRQVIELLPPPPLELMLQQLIKRVCPHCQRWCSPSLDLTEQLLGQRRIGVRIAALIAFLRTTLRMPIRRIQAYLHTLHQLTLRAGELVELLQQVEPYGAAEDRGSQTAGAGQPHPAR
jgi:hypothetical protein